MTKKRKKDILFFVIVFAIAFIFILASCKTQKVTEVYNPPPPAPKEENNYQKWNPEIQAKLEALKVDPLKISFFNSATISLNQNLVKEIVSVVEGEVFLVDSVFQVQKTIEKETVGALKEKKTMASPVVINFSENDKSYQMTFIYLKEENAYILASTALFLFRGIENKIIPKTTERCYLLFSLKKEKIVTEINENAEGIPQQ